MSCEKKMWNLQSAFYQISEEPKKDTASSQKKAGACKISQIK